MPRITLQDMKASLRLGSTAYVNSGTPYATPASGTTVMFWCKLNSYTNSGCLFNNVVAGNLAMVISQPGLLNCLTAGYYNGSSYVGVCTTNPVIRYGEWMHVAFTLTGTTGLLYINGTLDNQGATNPTSALSPVGMSLNARVDNSYPSNGQYSNMYFYGSVLTQTQIVSAMNGVYPSGANRILNLNEGSGTVAYDSSGNGNNGTITSGTYVADTPTKLRQSVNGNLVKNGDFEYAPPFVAATDTSGRWIDGTAAGNTTNNLFGWSFSKGTSSSASFDSSEKRSGTHSMKASVFGVSSYVEIKNDVRNTYDTVAGTGFEVLPSTSYTLTYWMKTANMAGDSADGAFITTLCASGDGTNIGAPTGGAGPRVKVNTDWTQYILTFTTQATARRAHLELRFYGHNGAGTLTGDAWFDDITLTPTTPITRQDATGRQVATVARAVA